MDTPHRVWGGDTEAAINEQNQWMRAQPWYQAQLAQWGQDPNNVHLSKEQGRQIIKLAQANGAQIDEGKIEVDPGGNFNPIGHKMRNALIAAGIAAGGYFAAPAIAGALAGSGGAAGAAGAGAAGAGGGGAALGGGATLAANLGGAGALGAGGAGLAGAGTTAAALGGGSTLAANLGGAGALGAGGSAGTATTAATGGSGVLSSLAKAGSATKYTDMGNALSQAGSGMAEGRRADALSNARAIADNNRARLDSAQFNVGVPLTRAQQVARGDLMSANIPQSQVSGSGRTVSFSGGIGPQYFGADTTAAGDALKRQALTALMTGSDKIDPQLIQPSKAGAGENILSGLGMAANLYGAYRGR